MIMTRICIWMPFAFFSPCSFRYPLSRMFSRSSVILGQVETCLEVADEICPRISAPMCWLSFFFFLPLFLKKKMMLLLLFSMLQDLPLGFIMSQYYGIPIDVLSTRRWEIDVIFAPLPFVSSAFHKAAWFGLSWVGYTWCFQEERSIKSAPI